MATSNPENQGKTIQLLEVKTVQGVKRFRRGGYGFGETPVQIPLKDLTKEQIKVIKNEPHLDVRVIKRQIETED